MSSKKERRKAKKRNDKLRDEAWDAVERGKLDLGLRRIQRAVQHGPANALYWHDQGLILELCGDPGAAFRSLAYAVQLSPNYASALRKMADLSAECGTTDRAVALLKQVLAVVPDDRGALAELERLGAHASPGAAIRGDPADEHPPDSERTSRYDWVAIEAELTATGCCVLPGLLDEDECQALIGLDGCSEAFEHEVRLGERGQGEALYRFFGKPLPTLVADLRAELYWRLAPVASRWNALLGSAERFPPLLADFLGVCRAEGQTRTTPLLFRYERGASNDFHRDLSGRVFFPLQLVVTLGPGNAADGGGNEFALADIRAAKRKRARELSPGVGDGVVFCTRDRLLKVGGAYGRQPVMHGVKPLLAARRFALGVPFHDYR